jgi:hypothetical protein
MKKSILFWIGVLVVTLSTGLSSCNTDGESDFNTGNVNYESNPINLNGTWHMVSASFGYQVVVIHYSVEASGNRDVRYIYSFHDGMLVLDSGMASDGPGYYLKKLI